MPYSIIFLFFLLIRLSPPLLWLLLLSSFFRLFFYYQFRLFSADLGDYSLIDFLLSDIFAANNCYRSDFVYIHSLGSNTKLIRIEFAYQIGFHTLCCCTELSQNARSLWPIFVNQLQILWMRLFSCWYIIRMEWRSASRQGEKHWKDIMNLNIYCLRVQFRRFASAFPSPINCLLKNSTIKICVKTPHRISRCFFLSN